MAFSISRSVCEEIGIPTMQRAHRNVHIILCMRFIRMCALGVSPVMALSFTQLGFTDLQIGFFMTFTMAGIVILGSVLALKADTVGRKKVLFGGSLLTFASGLLLTTSTSYWVFRLCTILGRLTPGGDDTGPFRAVEESILAHHVPKKFRTEVYAWYTVAGTFGAVCGSLFCVWGLQFLRFVGYDGIDGLRYLFAAYGVLGLIKACLVYLLNDDCELAYLRRTQTNHEGSSRPYGNLDSHQEHRTLLETDDEAESGSAQVEHTAPGQEYGRVRDSAEMGRSSISLLRSFSQRSREMLTKLCIVSALDSFGSGLVLTPMLALYVVRRYEIREENFLGTIAIVRILSAISSIFTPSIARRIGLVRAIVLTHLPSALLIAMVPLPASWTLTIVILVAGMSLSSTDQAMRSALVSASFSVEHTTAAMGAISIAKTATAALGPTVTGILASNDQFGVTFVLAGCFKASHDLGLIATFWGSGIREPEEDLEERSDGIVLR